MWFRNPIRWMPSLVDAGATKVAWHRGLLIKRSIEPVAHARLHFPAGVDWRVLSVGQQGVQEWTPDSVDMNDPVACYPIWQYGEPITQLEDLCRKNAAEDPATHSDPNVEPRYRMRPGQEHRVVIGSYPHLQHGIGQRFLALIGELQADYPDCILHLFSATTVMFLGTGLRSGDFDPWTLAAKGSLSLPNGRVLFRADFAKGRQWMNLLGYSDGDFQTIRKRLEFNIKAAEFGALHWHEHVNFRSMVPPASLADLDRPLSEISIPERTAHAVYSGSPKPGDKISCQHCSLSHSCKLYREGSVCTLSSSETSGLVAHFKTRDSNRIIEGLGKVLAVQAQRAEAALEVEQGGEDLNPELTRVLTQVFEGGVKLAKLVNPALAAAGATRVAVQINNGHQITAASPAALMAGLVRELEERGVDRGDITPEMVLGLLEPPKGDVIDVE
jgi:hypothetical protein